MTTKHKTQIFLFLLFLLFLGTSIYIPVNYYNRFESISSIDFKYIIVYFSLFGISLFLFLIVFLLLKESLNLLESPEKLYSESIGKLSTLDFLEKYNLIKNNYFENLSELLVDKEQIQKKLGEICSNSATPKEDKNFARYLLQKYFIKPY